MASRKQTTPRSTRPTGSRLVIVESPAKAKTINRYLGPGFVVQASVGHVRDLPARAPKGSKQPVPGVDLENDFEPTYEVLPTKKKTVAALKKAAREAAEVWFATDLDREGEAIAWHLAQELGIDPASAKRVIFNAITKSQIEHAFANPHPIDMDKVNAQQARRILDRIVGYQVSPLLWKKVARGLSAGRVQSVALRLVVEREREIRAFIPSEYWRVTVRLASDPDAARDLGTAWRDFVRSHADARGRGPAIKAQNAWLAEHASLRAELVELGGKKFELGCPPDRVEDLSREVARVADAVGLLEVKIDRKDNPEGRGPEKVLRRVEGRVDPKARYAVTSIQTRRTTSKPPPPFITSTLQQAASTALGFGAQRTMRTAQALYEGVLIPREGQVGLITYMRTDSTHLSQEALQDVRGYIKKSFGARYLPDQPNIYGSSGQAQEAHEAIRPADPNRHPDSLARALTEEQLKLYRLIWNRFVACQMTPAEWDTTTVMMERRDRRTGAVLKAGGRVLVFDGFTRVSGTSDGDEPLLPELAEEQALAPFSIDPEQLFTSPPPRYTEASLVKALESEGIGRPSTYAQIIEVIQERRYVEQVDRRFYATDLGEVVTDKLVEAFSNLMDLGYTRQMEAELDRIEDNHTDWVSMLRGFYKDFSRSLELAHKKLVHAKAESLPAPYKCPKCGSRTSYRFGRNGRFLSCSAYPGCDYAAPIDRDGRPLLPEEVDVLCPEDGSHMVLRNGRFGPFLASVDYPRCNFVINIDKKGRLKYPSPPALQTELPCPRCGAALSLREGRRGPWLGCSAFPKCRGRSSWSKLDEATRRDLQARLDEHRTSHPEISITHRDGRRIEPGTPVSELVIPGGVATLAMYDEVMPRAKTA